MPNQHVRKQDAPDLEPDAGENSIRVVSEVTGIPMETLRAWERRYAFPKPLRPAGSNRRKYSDDDVEKLKAVAKALRHGYRPGDVIAKSLMQIRALTGEAQVVEDVSRAPDNAQAPLSLDVGTLIRRLEHDDMRGIEDALRMASIALGPRRFVTDLVQPLAIEVGRAWVDGRIAIRQEHAMTECITTQLRLLLSAQQDMVGDPTVVLATLPTEPHTLGLQMSAVYLAMCGAKPRLLGANTPAEEIVDAVAAFGAAVIGITVTEVADLELTREAVKLLARTVPRHVLIWIGGAHAKHLRDVAPSVRVVDSWAAVDAAVAEARLVARVRR